jgi:hypothetical protein
MDSGYLIPGLFHSAVLLTIGLIGFEMIRRFRPRRRGRRRRGGGFEHVPVTRRFSRPRSAMALHRLLISVVVVILLGGIGFGILYAFDTFKHKTFTYYEPKDIERYTPRGLNWLSYSLLSPQNACSYRTHWICIALPAPHPSVRTNLPNLVIHRRKVFMHMGIIVDATSWHAGSCETHADGTRVAQGGGPGPTHRMASGKDAPATWDLGNLQGLEEESRQ